MFFLGGGGQEEFVMAFLSFFFFISITKTTTILKVISLQIIKKYALFIPWKQLSPKKSNHVLRITASKVIIKTLYPRYTTSFCFVGDYSWFINSVTAVAYWWQINICSSLGLALPKCLLSVINSFLIRCELLNS